MADAVPTELERQLGPFPLWGWLAIVTGGVGLGLFLRHHNAAKAAAAVVTGAAGDPAAAGDLYAPGLSDGGVGYSGGSGGSTPSYGDGTVPIPGQSNPPTTPAITSNSQWANAAVQWAIQTGKNPLDMSNAVAKYLQAIDLSTSEAALVNQALTALGPPPEGAPSVIITPGGTSLPPVSLPPTTTLPPGVTTVGNGTGSIGNIPPIGGARFGTPGPAFGAFGGGGRILRATQPYPTGQDVKEWQARMNARRYGVGAVDGVYGPSSAAAAQAIQRDYHLTVDGAVGPATWAATFDGSGGYGPNS